MTTDGGNDEWIDGGRLGTWTMGTRTMGTRAMGTRAMGTRPLGGSTGRGTQGRPAGRGAQGGATGRGAQGRPTGRGAQGRPTGRGAQGGWSVEISGRVRCRLLDGARYHKWLRYSTVAIVLDETVVVVVAQVLGDVSQAGRSRVRWGPHTGVCQRVVANLGLLCAVVVHRGNQVLGDGHRSERCNVNDLAGVKYPHFEGSLGVVVAADTHSKYRTREVIALAIGRRLHRAEGAEGDPVLLGARSTCTGEKNVRRRGRAVGIIESSYNVLNEVLVEFLREVEAQRALGRSAVGLERLDGPLSLLCVAVGARVLHDNAEGEEEVLTAE